MVPGPADGRISRRQPRSGLDDALGLQDQEPFRLTIKAHEAKDEIFQATPAHAPGTTPRSQKRLAIVPAFFPEGEGRAHPG